MIYTIQTTLSTNEASPRHRHEVGKLTLYEIMELNNKNLVPTDLVDNLYYFLLDDEKIREELLNESR